MKKVFIAVLFLFTITSTSLSQQKTIAILDFSNNSLAEKEKFASLSAGLAEIMITELSRINSLQIVERQKINSLIQEMQLAQSGLISEDTGIQVGKLIGAQYLVFGSYMVSFDKKIRVDVRIVEVETGLTIKASEVTDKISKVFEIIKKLNEKIVKDLDIKLSKGEKNALQEEEASLDVVAFFSKGLEFEDAKQIDKAKQMYIKALKIDKNFEPAKKRLMAIMK